MSRKIFICFAFLASIVLAYTSPANAYYAKLVGNVYVMDNNPEGNKLIVFGRFSNGALVRFGSVPTGGLGAGDNASFDPLGSQESIIISEDKRSLFLVNAGSDSISVFRLTKRGRPILTQVISSEGDFPVSLTTDEEFVYVVNAGSDGSIAGYKIRNNGRLSHLEGSVRSLGTGLVGIPEGLANVTAPGDIAFDTLNRRLLIPFGESFDLGSGQLFTFSVDDDGMPSAEATVTESPGRTPFAVEFTSNGVALVANVFGNDPNSINGGGLSSLNFTSGANLEPVNTIVINETGSCWVVAANNSDLVYATNTLSNTISSYRVSRNGVITLVEEVAASDIENAADFDITDDDKFLYVTASTPGIIKAYRINSYTGALTFLADFTGLPAFAVDGFASQGLAVR